jgi:site-specific DNA recombinase
MNEIQAALYARVSSEQQVSAQTVASQVAALKQRMAADGCRCAEESAFIDEGYSGATLVRPALERLRDAIAAGALDRLYVHSPDRLARKYAYQVLLIDEFQRAGVEVVFLNRALGETPEDELLLQVQGMVAEYERAKILERSRRGKRHKASRGEVSVLSGAPYGYRYISIQEGGGQAHYEPVAEEARVVRQVFEWVGRERLSIGEVARRLTQEGIPTRTGKTMWERTSVWDMLRNPAYRGEAAFGKTRVGPLHPRLRAQRGRPMQPRRAQSVQDVPSAEWWRIPVPALVSEDLYAAVNEQLQENRRRARTRQRGARYLLQGLLACKQCGYAYYGKAISPSARKHHPRHYAYYRCIGADAYRFGGERICRNPQVRTDRLEEAVWQEVQGLLEAPQRLLEEYTRRLNDPSRAGGQADPTGLSKQIAQARQGVARLIDAYADGYLEKSEFEPRLTRLKERVARLEAQRQQQVQEAQAEAELRLVIGRLEDFGARVRDGLHYMDWLQRRELIRTLVKRVEIDQDEVNVVFRVQPTPDPSAPDAFLPDCGRGQLALAVESVHATIHPWVETGRPGGASGRSNRQLRR